MRKLSATEAQNKTTKVTHTASVVMGTGSPVPHIAIPEETVGSPETPSRRLNPIAPTYTPDPSPVSPTRRASSHQRVAGPAHPPTGSAASTSAEGALRGAVPQSISRRRSAWKARGSANGIRRRVLGRPEICKRSGCEAIDFEHGD
jgi:hypothetical protein